MLNPTGTVISTGPSLLVIEIGLTLITFLIAFCRPRTGRFPILLERWFGLLARRRGLAVLTIGIAAGLLRLSILPWSPAPEPFIHDEFSFLLAADTFASGRLTNPTHPMWIYFESFHITHQPTYMSMYFPAQGLVLAAGKVLFGHPWFGVWLSTALMCSAMCWMLQCWLPPGWAFFGGWLAIMRLGLFSYWVNMYYGGTVAAIGGCLVLGAVPRIKRTARARDFLLLAAGAVLLANSRPYEGVLVCLPVAVGMAWWLGRKDSPPAPVLIGRTLLPLALLLLSAGGMAYYNHRVFGNALTLPYQVNRATYARAPVFLWLKPRPEPVYRYKVLRDFYTQWELGDFQRARTLPGFLTATAQKTGVMLMFFFGVVLLLPLMMLPWAIRDHRVRFLVVAGGVYAVGLSANAWFFPHYAAPFIGGLYVLLLQSMRYLRVWRPEGQPAGLFLVRAIPVLCILLLIPRLFAGPLHISIGRWPVMSMWYGMEPVGLERARILADLHARPGRHLAIIRYAPGHLPFDDWVYNAADIDNSKVVWAREPENGNPSDLLGYFKTRNIWLVQPDMVPPHISPYPTGEPGKAVSPMIQTPH